MVEDDVLFTNDRRASMCNSYTFSIFEVVIVAHCAVSESTSKSWIISHIDLYVKALYKVDEINTKTLQQIPIH